MSAVRSVHDHDFSDVVLGSAIPVVVGLCVGWSVACEPLGSVLDELATGADWLGVVRLDIDEAPRTAAAYRMGSTPSVLVFSGGSLVLALPGIPSTTTILSMLQVVLPSAVRPTVEPA